MKNLITIILTIYSSLAIGQSNVSGFYDFHNGVTYRTIDLKPDSTFSWTYRSDLSRENREGHWHIKSDTLILKFIPDTLIRQAFNKVKGAIIDATIYEESTSKWLITDELRINTFYRTKNDTTNPSEKYMPSYYHKLLEYNENGSVVREYKYIYADGMKQLVLESTSYPNAIKKHIIEYEEGQKNGVEIEFHENGSVKFIGFWKNDTKTGLWKFFDENGRLEKVIKGKKLKTGTNKPASASRAK